MLARHWPSLRFGNVGVTRPNEASYKFEVQVYLDDVSPDAVSVELYADPFDGGEPVRQSMERGAPLAGTGNGFLYSASVPGDRPASAYTPRIIPQHLAAATPLEAHHILWYR